MNLLLSKSTVAAVVFCAFVFGLLCFWQAPSIDFPYSNLDEQGHVSYGLHLAQTGIFMPDLEAMRLLDFPKENWSTTPNFINHPPIGYHLLNLVTSYDSIGPSVRFGSVGFWSFGFLAILIGLHLSGQFSQLGLLAATILCVLLKIDRFGETFTNDSLAFIGGGIAFVGAVCLTATTTSRKKDASAIILTGVGLGLCIAAKLSAALVVGLFVTTLIILRSDLRKQSRSRWLLAVMILVCAALCLPYGAFVFKYGTPIPNTAGQLAMISQTPDALRFGFSEYIFQSFYGALGNAGPDAFFTYAVFALVTAYAAIKSFVRPSTNKIGKAVLVATSITLAVHIVFSYQRHIAYGWQPELYPRYYFPLLGPYLLLFFETISKFRPFTMFASPKASNF
jgi:4-amino-4-deoxy-L-arabinose transferase-like glycosyltransferase